jgi:hypothetical protein
MEQRKRLEQQAQYNAKGDEEAMVNEKDYILAMEYGMLPVSGWGMGIERLVQVLTNCENIKDCMLFPLLKPLEYNEISIRSLERCGLYLGSCHAELEFNSSNVVPEFQGSCKTFSGIPRQKMCRMLKIQFKKTQLTNSLTQEQLKHFVSDVHVRCPKVC